METIYSSITPDEFLTVATCGRVDFIERHNLVRVEAFSNYSKLFMSDGKTLFVAKVLKKLEDKLGHALFVRSHKTHLVNLLFVRSYIRGSHAVLLLTNGERIPVARNKRKQMDLKLFYTRATNS